MNDDIVTRLRDGNKACFCHDALDDYECDICPLHTEAADEIERLRRWQEWGLHVAACPNWTKRTCWDCVVPDLQDESEQQGTAALIKRETKRYGS
jgi:hypothetical protein